MMTFDFTQFPSGIPEIDQLIRRVTVSDHSSSEGICYIGTCIGDVSAEIYDKLLAYKHAHYPMYAEEDHFSGVVYEADAESISYICKLGRRHRVNFFITYIRKGRGK